MQKLKPLFWALCCTGLSSAAWAGLSPLRVLSQVGQPFEAEFSIEEESLPESTHVELADRNNYSVLAPYSPSAGRLLFSLVKKPGSERYVVKVHGPAQFDESQLRFAVEVSWADGRVVREYRLDPHRGAPPVPPGREEQPAKKAVPSTKPSLAMPAMLLGEIKLLSSIGQPLRAEVEVKGHGLHQGELNAHLELHADAASAIQVNVLSRDDKRAVLGLSSQAEIHAPVLSFRLQVNHGADQASKAYKLLMDPAKRHAARAAKYGRIAAAQASLTGPELHYRVQPGDSLYELASHLNRRQRPIDTVMERLVRDNPDAFIHADPNRLQAGATLDYPAQWGSLKAVEPTVAPPASKPTHATPVAPSAPPKLAPAKPTLPPVASVPVAAARKQELEQKLKQQDKQLQKLEGEARDLEQKLKVQATETKAQASQPVQPAPKVAQQASQITQAGPVKLVELPPDRPQQIGHSMEIKGGAAAALLLTSVGGMAWLYHRRRQHQVEQGLVAPQSLVMDEPPPPQTPEITQGVGIQDEPIAQRADWLAKVDALQAAGQYGEAIELMREGIALAPVRQDIHYKLLQMLGKQQDFPGFLDEARTVLDLFGLDSTIGRRVRQLGQLVMPAHPLFTSQVSPLEKELGVRSSDTESETTWEPVVPGSLWAQHATPVANSDAPGEGALGEPPHA